MEIWRVWGPGIIMFSGKISVTVMKPRGHEGRRLAAKLESRAEVLRRGLEGGRRHRRPL